MTEAARDAAVGVLKTNGVSLPDYGRCHRAGERVASPFVESAVNPLMDKRMSRSRQMHWSHAGAHRLLQDVQK